MNTKIRRMPTAPGSRATAGLISTTHVAKCTTTRGLRPLALAAALLAFVEVRCSTEGSAKTPAGGSAAPVRVAPVVQKPVPVEIQSVGTVEAYSSVEVKAQVDGELVAVHFREGQNVTKGQLLFDIDRRPLEAKLAQAEGELARDEAQAKNAEVQLRRYADLRDQKVVSEDQYDGARTSAAALEAAVASDRAAVENARLQLEYASILSPLDGRTGALLVHPGNLVKANDTSLVVIHEIRPVYVSFTVPERMLPGIRTHMASGKLEVRATVPEEESAPAEGIVTFVDNAVDAATGTIRLKATFPNRDEGLWPGNFVRVVLTLATEPGALVVPSQAVQSGQEGDYVFVVKHDQTVDMRPVVVERTVAGDAVIARGVQPGEMVVTDGQLRLVPGARVAIEEARATR